MHFNKRYIVKTLFWSALFAIYLLAVLPAQEVPELTPFSDKGNHIIAFFTLTLLLLKAYGVRYYFASIWMLIYGVFIEASQLFIVNRYGELLDLLADGVGIAGGVIVYWLYMRFLSPKER